MYISAAFSATLSIREVGVPSAPMQTSSPLHLESGILSISACTASAIWERVSIVIMNPWMCSLLL